MALGTGARRETAHEDWVATDGAHLGRQYPESNKGGYGPFPLLYVSVVLAVYFGYKTLMVAEHTFVKVGELIDGTALSALTVVSAAEQACAVTLDAVSDATVGVTVEVRRAWTYAIRSSRRGRRADGKEDDHEALRQGA